MKKFPRTNNYTDSNKMKLYLGEFCFRKKFKNDSAEKFFSRVMYCFYAMKDHEMEEEYENS